MQLGHSEENCVNKSGFDFSYSAPSPDSLLFETYRVKKHFFAHTVSLVFMSHKVHQMLPLLFCLVCSMSIFSIWGYYIYLMVRLYIAWTQFQDEISSSLSLSRVYTVLKAATILLIFSFQRSNRQRNILNARNKSEISAKET